VVSAQHVHVLTAHRAPRATHYTQKTGRFARRLAELPWYYLALRAIGQDLASLDEILTY
jgi:hypothetical protein